MGAIHAVAYEGQPVEGIALGMQAPGFKQGADALGGVDPIAHVEYAASARMRFAQLVGQGSGPAVGYHVDRCDGLKSLRQKGRNGGTCVGETVGPQNTRWKGCVPKVLVFRNYSGNALAPLHDAPQHQVGSIAAGTVQVHKVGLPKLEHGTRFGRPPARTCGHPRSCENLDAFER
jgi:hypothetical protein